jgi:deoxyribodipyrimidine photo-lyase
MKKRIGLFWLRDDFRIKRNLGLYEATKNHDEVVVFYLYKKLLYQNQQAQRWWLSKSLLNFKKKLSSFNIGLEIIKTDSFKIFFNQLLKKKNFSIYWNKVYEPDYLKFDQFLLKNLKAKEIPFKICKGNVLNEIDEVKKIDGTPFKVFTPFWRNAEKYYLEKIPKKERIIKKCLRKKIFFQNCIDYAEILPKKNWFKEFEKLWTPK